MNFPFSFLFYLLVISIVILLCLCGLGLYCWLLEKGFIQGQGPREELWADEEDEAEAVELQPIAETQSVELHPLSEAVTVIE